jgi:hypothetical protein
MKGKVNMRRRSRVIWVDGQRCESILAGVMLLREKLNDPDLGYFQLYNAIRYKKMNVRGVRVALKKPEQHGS